jgi:hypothetical protein
MLTCHSERFETIIKDIEALVPIHWEEVATHKAARKCDPDWGGFLRADAADRLYCVTLRDGDKLVGYNIGFYQTEPHVKDRWVAQADAYFILDEYRAVGARFLFLQTEKILKAHPTHPAETIHYHAKEANRAGEFFAAMGYERTAVVWSKLLQKDA